MEETSNQDQDQEQEQREWERQLELERALGEKFRRTFSTPDGKDVLEFLRINLKVDAVFYPEEDEKNRKPIDPISMAIRQGRVSAFNVIVTMIDKGS